MEPFLAAALQLNSQPNLDLSLEQAGSAVKQAVGKGAALIALPENFAFLGDEKERHRQMDAISEAVMKTVPQWAKTYGVTILAGGFPVRAKNGKMYNRAILFNRQGMEIARYDKIHLFDITLSKEESYRESDLVEPGAVNAVVSELQPGLRIGLSICYDVRFPELYRKLADLQADILCVPAAFTRPTGESHWEILLRSRAIENSAYLIAPAQTGTHGEKRKTYGHAMIIDPWGRVLSDAGTAPGMTIAEIRMDYLREIRKKLPSLKHRRPGL